jgi:hypothetical protein
VRLVVARAGEVVDAAALRVRRLRVVRRARHAERAQHPALHQRPPVVIAQPRDHLAEEAEAQVAVVEGGPRLQHTAAAVVRGDQVGHRHTR